MLLVLVVLPMYFYFLQIAMLLVLVVLPMSGVR
jgi:hypothetical protein